MSLLFMMLLWTNESKPWLGSSNHRPVFSSVSKTSHRVLRDLPTLVFSLASQLHLGSNTSCWELCVKTNKMVDLPLNFLFVPS